MAIDTREERQSAVGLMFLHVPLAVDAAVAGFPQSSRQASIHAYAGINAGTGVEGQPTMGRWRQIPFMCNRPLFGRGY